jgi:hypothetical protein
LASRRSRRRRLLSDGKDGLLPTLAVSARKIIRCSLVSISMLTRKQLAAHWRISPQMAGRYLQRGCPTDSLEAADRWRKANFMAKGSKTAPPSEIILTPNETDERAETMILESGSADRETLQSNLRTLQQMTKQCKAAAAAAIANGDTEAGRRWTHTLTNVLQRSATIAKELQAVLREDRITIRFEDAEALYIGLLKEMRQIVLQGVESLPARVNPIDPHLAREALREWLHHVFMRQMHGQVGRCGADPAALDNEAQPAQRGERQKTNIEKSQAGTVGALVGLSIDQTAILEGDAHH